MAKNGFKYEPIEIEDSHEKLEAKLEDIIEKNLYKIFKFIQNGNAKEGKNICDDLSFEYSSFPMDWIEYNNKIYTIHKEARIIKFFNKNNKKLKLISSHFIMSPEYFKVILQENNIINFIVLSSDTNLDDSNVSNNDYSSAFYDTNITSILIYSVSNILTQENFNKRLIKKFGFVDCQIKELSLNAQKYFADTAENKFIKFNGISDYTTQLLKYVEKIDYKKILYFLGTKGCGKSTFLLAFVQFIHRIKQYWGTMYFNARYLDNLSLVGNKKNLLKESLYLVSNLDELQKFKEYQPFKNIDKISVPIFTIKHFIKEVIKNYNNIFLQNKECIIFIIDNFQVENEAEINCLKDIISDITSAPFNLKLIISGVGKFFGEKIRKYFLKNVKNNESVIYMDSKLLEYKNYEKKIIISEMVNFPPLYYFSFKKNMNFLTFKEKKINEEKNYLQKYNFINLFYSLDINKLVIALNELENLDIFDSLPDYYNINYVQNDKIKIEVGNPIFLESIKQTIEYMVEKDMYKKRILEKKLQETACGNAEEYLITLLFKFNKFKVKNLCEFEHIKKVKAIFDLKNMSNINFNETYNGNILITQDFFAENYDLLAIITIQEIDYAIFIQIGVDKDEKKIKKISDELSYNYEKYIKHLNYSFKKNITYVNLLFIFDEKNQESKIRKTSGKSCGSKICENLGIDYLWYSLEQDHLFSIKFTQKIFKKKFAITEYIPNKFLLHIKAESQNSTKENLINLNYEIKPLLKLDSIQEKYIQNFIIEQIFESKYVFSTCLGKNFQFLFPSIKIRELIPLIEKGKFPYVHIFAGENKKRFFLLANNILFYLDFDENKILQTDFEKIESTYVSWDIYELEEKDILNK